MKREKQHEVSPRSPVKDEDLGLGVVSRDALRSCQSLLVSFVFIATGIVVEIIAIPMDDAHDREQRWVRAILRLLSVVLNGKGGTARRKQYDERRVTKAHEEDRE